MNPSDNFRKIPLHGSPGALDVEAVVENAVQDRSADQFVVVGLGRDLQWPGAEEPTAAASGLVLGIMDIEVGHLAVGQGTEAAVEVAFTTAVLAAVGTRMALGGAAHDADLRQEHGLASLARRRYGASSPASTP
jgi:hypothetical protein